jgi:hypothetical protein
MEGVMRPRVWVWSLTAAGLVLSLTPPSPAASSRRVGGGLSVRFRSGNFSARFRAFSNSYRSVGYYPGSYGGYYPDCYGFYPPRRFYPPDYYGGYFSVYPAFGYGYPYDDFPIYDFPVYAGLPLPPVGFLSPSWLGWYAPVALWPRLFFGDAAVSRPATRVVVLPPRVVETPAPSGAEEQGSRSESERGPEPAPTPGEGPGKGRARVEALPAAPAAVHRTVTLRQLRVEWMTDSRTVVSWAGDPRVIGELRIEERDAAGRQLTQRRIDAYPFRASFDRDPKTHSLRVTALAGDETVATANFPVQDQSKSMDRRTDAEREKAKGRSKK